jgi:hypothetical protein
MASSRWMMAVAGLAGSLALSVLLWVAFGSPFVFLFVPFVPFLLRRQSGRKGASAARCPDCDFRTMDPQHEYCPRDGRRLIED